MSDPTHLPEFAKAAGLSKARALALWEYNLARAWNKAIEAAAGVVHNDDHEGERDCVEVANEVLELRKSVRPDAIEAIFDRREDLADKDRTADEEAEWGEIKAKLADLPFGRDPQEQEAHDFICRAADLLRASR